MDANVRITSASTLKLLDGPRMPLRPERPNRLHIILIGTGLGLLLSGLAAITIRINGKSPARSNPVF